MNILQKEALDAVEKINCELYDKYSDRIDDMPILCVTIAGEYTFISLSIPSKANVNLPEIHLFNSENDDRIYYEESDKYESLYKLIKRKFIEIKKEIYNTKL